MNYFVEEESIVRKIWGNSDTILLVFAGASAEFALNRAVDWLYFTGKLPNDPLVRLFSTVNYAKKIVYAETEKATQAIQTIKAIHTTVEEKRGKSIPNWAYEDVLFMLIDYSIKSFEILERPLTVSEKEEVLNVFRNVGNGMGLENLPENYTLFQKARKEHLNQNLEYSGLTRDLYNQYKKHLGVFRYKILMEAQLLICPKQVSDMLDLKGISFLKPLVPLYKISRILKMDSLFKPLIIPRNYMERVRQLNIATN